MTHARLLDRKILEAFEQRLVAAKIKAIEYFRPGLSSEQIDETMRKTGLSLPDEVRIWWQWHDGTDDVSCQPLGLRWLGPSFYSYPLAEAVTRYNIAMESAAKIAAQDPRPASYWWNRTWFPVVGLPAGEMACDCAAGPGDPSPIRVIESSKFDGGDFHTPLAASLGDVVVAWINAIDAGAWAQDDSRWSYRGGPEWQARHDAGLV